ncbi:Auxin-responsive protein [Actinidia chinensis var. chinensis]|uniref:Auxin-responsive protein n=1 Tax=Actinidia chinensis var. chinensis TaxID=1590841 RepID=A0A2R6PGW9_ACTCC|nr:Auxin-responsive protein [Actinidia chinensis var. chinensis]
MDLGLSLRALQSEAYHPSGHDDYSDLIDWHELNPELKSSKMGYPTKNSEDCDDERVGVGSKERWDYVKVNMEGVIVGRKICIIEDMDYSSLAVQLEDMFGRQTVPIWVTVIPGGDRVFPVLQGQG